MNRKHELFLIDLGLKTLIEQATGKKVKTVQKRGGVSGRRWTKKQHAKFANTMRKVWAEKKKQANK